MKNVVTRAGFTIAEWVDAAYELAEIKGFHEDIQGNHRTETLLRLCLVHTEVSEAAQEVKRHWTGEPTSAQRAVFAEELADILIRVFDLAGTVGCDLQGAVTQKMVKNAARPTLYGTPRSE